MKDKLFTLSGPLPVKLSPHGLKSQLSNRTAIFPIVGIGASAGGLEALQQFFRLFPANSGMAFVLVQHLDPSHPSLLTELLQRATAMLVVEAVNKILIHPNVVYVIPPNRDMAVFQGKLKLSIPIEPRGQRMPINNFLRSMAEDRQEQAIGIILSGAGTDGTLGCRAIQGVGGVTMVQDPASTKYHGMPTSVIKAGYATQVLLIEKMPEALLAVSHGFTFHAGVPSSSKTASGISRILAQLHSSTGHDFSQYKQSLIGRRIELRMLQHNILGTDNYASYLKENPLEVQALFKELLINITSFFRDAEAFLALKNVILPQLCKHKPEDYPFRVWVAGCSTGEEAYSIAILLRELMTETHQEFKVLIYGTDLAEDVIAIARAGVYPASIAKDVTEERLRRFFIQEDAGYRVRNEIRQMVVFANQDLIKDPPFINLDLLSCRNVMIYLDADIQKRLISTFRYALKPDGILFVSPSENIGNQLDLFTLFDSEWRLYRAIGPINPSSALMASVWVWPTESGGNPTVKTMIPSKETNFAEITRRALVQYYAPDSVVTDLNGNTLFMHGDTGKYLRPAPGKASLNLIAMARDGLDLVLPSAMRSAANDSVPMLNRVIQINSNDGFKTISLSVRPILDSDDKQNLLLVSFQEVASPVIKPGQKRISKPAELSRVEELERDLAYLKENYQASIEERQSSSEELKFANEEMQSTNEELQQSNAKLETSKLELQSINENLVTVNEALHGKIEQLASMQNDIKNLFDNIHIGTVFLDHNMRIRRFTRETTNIFRLLSSDIGRSLSDIKSNLKNDELLSQAKIVLESLVPFEQEVQADNGTWFMVRIQPYRNLDNILEGVVLTFTNISKRIEAERSVQQARDLAEGIVDSIQAPLLILDSSLQVVSANRAFYQYFHVTRADTIGFKVYELGNGQWNIPALRKLLEVILPQDQAVEGYVVEHSFPVIGLQKISLNARRIPGNAFEPALILLTADEICDKDINEAKG